MLIQNKVVQSKLKAIAGGLGNEKTDSEDLMQEMMIHLWKVEQDRPGMTESWYLQNCKFFARDLVRKGTSIDTRRRTEVMLVSKDNLDQQKMVLSKPVEQYDFRSELIVKDLIGTVMGKLGETQRRIFRALLTGMTLTEIGKKMHFSHQRISYGKKRIAAIALRELKHASMVLMLTAVV